MEKLIRNLLLYRYIYKIILKKNFLIYTNYNSFLFCYFSDFLSLYFSILQIFSRGDRNSLALRSSYVFMAKEIMKKLPQNIFFIIWEYLFLISYQTSITIKKENNMI